MRVPFFSIMFLTLVIACFVDIAIITGVRWYVVVLICISLIASEVEHFIYLIAVCMSS